MFPLASVVFVAELFKLTEDIPASASVNKVPSPFNTFKSEKCSSLELTIPSPLESKSESASKPDVATVPPAFM